MLITLSAASLINGYILGFVKVVLTLLVVLSGRELLPLRWRNAVRVRIGMPILVPASSRGAHTNPN